MTADLQIFKCVLNGECVHQVRKMRRKPLKAEDIEPDIDWAHDFGSRSSRGIRHAAGSDSNENEYVKVKQEVIDGDDAMEIDDVPSKYSFIKLFLFLEV